MFDVMDKNFKRNYYSFNTEYIIYNLFNQQYRTSPSLFYLEMIPLYEILNDYFFYIFEFITLKLIIINIISFIGQTIQF